MGSMNDPIADLLTNIRNGGTAEKRFVEISWSKIKESILKVLKNQGFIAHYLIKEEDRKKTIRIFLKYCSDRTPVIQKIKRVSKPSLRKYVTSRDIPRVMGGMGIAILSTPKGIMDGMEARLSKVGGELICVAW